MTPPIRDDVARRWPLWLRRARKATPEPLHRADHGLWTVDRAVRVLATSCVRDNRPAPAVHAVVIGPDTVSFHLQTPDEPAPAGWTTAHDGRTWQASLRWLQSAEVAGELPEPYPQLVSLGAGRDGFVLLNLDRAGGIIALEGDARQARALAEDWSRELANSPWSRGVPVVRVGFQPGSADVPTLGDESGGGVLMLAGLPGGRDRERVHALADDPAGRWSVVVVGRVEQPRWRFTIDATGLVETGLFNGPVLHGPDAAWIPPAEAVPARTRRFSRPLIVAAAVGGVCVLSAVLALTLFDFSAPEAPGASAPSPSGSPALLASATPPRITPGSLVNPASGSCLSGAAGSDGTPLVLAPCDGNPNQIWTIAPDRTIRAKGLCMDAAWGATDPGTVVQLANCSGNPAQQFALRSDTLHAGQADLCATAMNAGAGIQLQPCADSASQIFRHS